MLIKRHLSLFSGLGCLVATALLLSILLSLPTPARAATFTVNTTNDYDDGSCTARHCSLREAVNAANANPGPDTITFNIPGSGPHTIRLPGDPLVLEDDGTTIDGTTQPGYSTEPDGFGTPAVILVGVAHLHNIGYYNEELWPPHTITVSSDNNVIGGLSLIACEDSDYVSTGLSIHGNRNLVERNYINVFPNGEPCEFEGMVNGINVATGGVPSDDMEFSSANSILGNWIAASGIGIEIEYADTAIVRGNHIGVNLAGTATFGPLPFGIFVDTDARNTVIGGGDAGEGNLISGAEIGILDAGESSQIIGNRIGTNAAGSSALPNTVVGVQVIGPDCVLQGNLISGNDIGIQVGGTYEAHLRYYSLPPAPGRNIIIQGNLIGTDINGSFAIPNGSGIVLGYEAETAQIGSPLPSNSNLISGNDIGIEVQGGSPTILGNRIGTNAAGTAAIPNQYGIVIWDRASDVRVGGSTAGEGNLISGNARTGLWFRANAGVIQKNLIGLTADGASALPNGTGLDIDGDSNRIGGAGAWEGNVISGNENGVVIDGDQNLILGNFIGTNNEGSAVVPNGVGMYLAGDNNALGRVEAPNLISGNNRGLVITGSHNTVYHNLVGTDLAAAVELPNGVGIELFGPYNQIGSGTLPGNQVLYNNGPGIRLSSLAVGNTITGNTIAYNAQEGIRVEPGGGVALNTFSRNSMYDNSWLGIDLLPGAQDDIAAPVFDSITIPGASTDGTIRGHACSDCKVELFLADPDRSGSGEGRTYTASSIAEGGAFTITIPIGATIGICQPFTATATDTDGNTSEFSLNMTPFGCWHISWIIIMLGVSGLLVVGVLVGGLSGGSRGRPWLGSAAGGAAGGLLGVVIVVVLTRLPSVQIVGLHIPQGGGSPVAPVPPCAQFLNSSQLHPEDGASFDLGKDILFELSPQPDPPGVQTRWTMHLSGPAGLEVAQLLSAPSASLGSIGVDDPAAGAYLWHLSAERLDGPTGDWNPFCADLSDRVFFLLQPTPPAPPMSLVKETANCRSGPTTEYPVLDILIAGTQLPIQGRNRAGDSWLVEDANISQSCWVHGSMVEVIGDTSLVMVIDPIPPGIVLPTVTTPFNCAQYNTNQQACSNEPACKWDPNHYPNSPCVSK